MHLQEYLNSECDRLQKRRVLLVLVTGSDMMKTGLHNELEYYGIPGLALVERHSFPFTDYGVRTIPSLKSQLQARCFYLPGDLEQEISSSLIHRLFVKGEDFSHLVPLQAIPLLQQYWASDEDATSD